MLALLAIRPLSVSVRHLMRRGLPCAVGLFVLSSCTASYEDVSHSPAFAARRGEACALSSDVVAHGIRRELSAAKSDPVFLDTVWTTMTAAKEAGHEGQGAKA